MLSAVGGQSPYTGEGTFTVGAGTYTYTVTDANSCSASATTTVVAAFATLAGILPVQYTIQIPD